MLDREREEDRVVYLVEGTPRGRPSGRRALWDMRAVLSGLQAPRGAAWGCGRRAEDPGARQPHGPGWRHQERPHRPAECRPTPLRA
jgi:hypothetical protein